MLSTNTWYVVVKLISLFVKNPFFTHIDINGKCNSGLSLYQLVELVSYWAHNMKVTTTMKWTGRVQHTVSD